MQAILLDMGHFHALAPITAERAHALLADLLVLFYQGQQYPLCFMPRTHWPTSAARVSTMSVCSKRYLNGWMSRVNWVKERTPLPTLIQFSAGFL